MPKIKAVVFDLDGTLVHTKPEYRHTVIGNALSHFGIEKPYEDIERLWFGKKRDGIIRSWGIVPENFWPVYKHYSESLMSKEYVKPYADADCLKDLAKNYRLGVFTGNSEKNALFELGLLGIDFDAVVIANPLNGIKKTKPNPYGMMLCLRELRAASSEAIYVGNAAEDIETARNASVRDILIDRGEHSVIVNPPPERVINNLYELERYLKN